MYYRFKFKNLKICRGTLNKTSGFEIERKHTQNKTHGWKKNDQTHSVEYKPAKMAGDFVVCPLYAQELEPMIRR